MLFGVPPQDPLALAVAAAILLCAATLAVLLPTGRATSMEPASVLRQSYVREPHEVLAPFTRRREGHCFCRVRVTSQKPIGRRLLSRSS
jgi:hypothetical protein